MQNTQTPSTTPTRKPVGYRYEQLRFKVGLAQIRKMHEMKIEGYDYDDLEYAENKIKESLWRGIMRYAQTLISQKTGNFFKPNDYRQDLLQELSCVFFERLMDYDPERAAPTTYFKPYFNDAIFRYLNSDSQNLKAYDANNLRIVKSAISEFTSKRINYNYEMLSLKTGLSQKVIKNTLYYGCNSIRADIDDENLKSKTKSHLQGPLDLVLQNESRTILMDCVNSLPDNERNVFLRKLNLSGKERTYKEVAQECKISERDAKILYNNAIQILANDPRILMLYKH